MWYSISNWFDEIDTAQLFACHHYPPSVHNLKFKGISPYLDRGHVVAQLVEALSYKPEGLGFHSRWCHWNFSLT
jgi:hypothetical protein